MCGVMTAVLDRAAHRSVGKWSPSVSARTITWLARRRRRIEVVEDAVVTDRQELGRVIARLVFALEAVITVADEARRRWGRKLPSPPLKLATGRHGAGRRFRD